MVFASRTPHAPGGDHSGIPERIMRSRASRASCGVNPKRAAERAARVSAMCRFLRRRFSPGRRTARFCFARRDAEGSTGRAPTPPVLHDQPFRTAAATISSGVASSGASDASEDAASLDASSSEEARSEHPSSAAAS